MVLLTTNSTVPPTPSFRIRLQFLLYFCSKSFVIVDKHGGCILHPEKTNTFFIIDTRIRISNHNLLFMICSPYQSINDNRLITDPIPIKFFTVSNKVFTHNIPPGRGLPRSPLLTSLASFCKSSITRTSIAFDAIEITQVPNVVSGIPISFL